MITKIGLNRKNTIHYLYATWHASIFDNFCGIQHSESFDYGTFGRIILEEYFFKIGLRTGKISVS